MYLVEILIDIWKKIHVNKKRNWSYTQRVHSHNTLIHTHWDIYHKYTQLCEFLSNFSILLFYYIKKIVQNVSFFFHFTCVSLKQAQQQLSANENFNNYKNRTHLYTQNTKAYTQPCKMENSM